MVTDAYRISGSVQTRFARLTDLLNQHARTHLTITHARISEHVDPTATVAASSALVAVPAILINVRSCPTPIRSSVSKSKVTAAAPHAIEKWRELIKKVWEADTLRCSKGSPENAHRFAHRRLRSCISSPNREILTIMGDSNPKNIQKKKTQQSAKKVSSQKKPVAPSVPAPGKRK